MTDDTESDLLVELLWLVGAVPCWSAGRTPFSASDGIFSHDFVLLDTEELASEMLLSKSPIRYSETLSTQNNSFIFQLISLKTANFFITTGTVFFFGHRCHNNVNQSLIQKNTKIKWGHGRTLNKVSMTFLFAVYVYDVS